MGACLRHQLSNLRKENLLQTPERRCTWSAKNTWILMKWILRRSRVSYNSHNSKWRSADAWRGHSVCQRIGLFSWHWRSSITRQQYCRSESFAMKTGTPTNGSMVKNHISLKTGFELFVTQNFFPTSPTSSSKEAEVSSQHPALRRSESTGSIEARLGNSMDSILSVQNKHSSGNWKELAKVLGADAESQSHLHW